MPYFSGHSELLPQRMRDRERLPELGPVNRSLDYFIEEEIDVVVKAFYVSAGKKEGRVSRAASIEVGRVSAVNSTEITQRNRGPGPFSPVENALHSERYIARPVCGLTASAGMGKRFAHRQQFDPAR